MNSTKFTPNITRVRNIIFPLDNYSYIYGYKQKKTVRPALQFFLPKRRWHRGGDSCGAHPASSADVRTRASYSATWPSVSSGNILKGGHEGGRCEGRISGGRCEDGCCEGIKVLWIRYLDLGTFWKEVVKEDAVKEELCGDGVAKIGVMKELRWSFIKKDFFFLRK